MQSFTAIRPHGPSQALAPRPATIGVPSRHDKDVNVGEVERAVSGVLGGTLLLLGLGRPRSLGAAAMMVAGGDLLYRSVSGHCHLYQALGVNTAEAGQERQAEASAAEAEVRRAITVGKPADELYRLWLEPGTLPLVMAPFAEVTVDGEQTRWVVDGPLGRSFEWQTHVKEDRPGRFLRWEPAEGSPLRQEGSVEFRTAPGDRGSEVELQLRFEPPGGGLGQAITKLLGFVPRALVDKALHRFKSLAETGEVPTTERQPAARPDPR